LPQLRPLLPSAGLGCGEVDIERRQRWHRADRKVGIERLSQQLVEPLFLGSDRVTQLQGVILSLGQPGFRSSAESLENFAGSSNIFLVPKRMILRHGFAPKRQSEIRSKLLRLAKVLGRIVVFKVVELRQAEKKVCLRRRRPGIHKRNFTVRLGQRGCRTQKQQSSEERDSENCFHWDNYLRIAGIRF